MFMKEIPVKFKYKYNVHSSYDEYPFHFITYQGMQKKCNSLNPSLRIWKATKNIAIKLLKSKINQKCHYLNQLQKVCCQL